MITAGTRVIVLKGCRARDVQKGSGATVRSVTALGADYSHSVKVVLEFVNGRVLAFYARHTNRLSDSVVNLNDGNPLHKIEIRQAVHLPGIVRSK